MSDLYLDLQSPHQMTDFLLEASEYLPGNDPLRERVETIVDQVHSEKTVSNESLAMLAKEVGKATWIPRIAIKRYLKTQEGQHDEWRRVVAAVSRSTAHLLERFRAGTKRDAIEEVLEHEESGTAFHEKERYEINEVRRHVLPAIWREKKDDFAGSVEELKEELTSIETRISILRDLGFSTEDIDDAEVMGKVTRLEDRLYFEGEEIDPEKIDVEINTYREQAGI